MLEASFDEFRSSCPFRRTLVSLIDGSAIEIDYQEVEGGADSEVLVLLPPISGSSSSWFPQLKFWRERTTTRPPRVVALSYPCVTDLSTLVVVLDLFFDALGVTRRLHLGGCG
jgi:pimeloyl-ACP methyl ester carboxylesterase